MGNLCKRIRNINIDGIDKIISKKDTICILSNILCYCTNNQTADLFDTLLNKHNVKCILVNERGATQEMVDLLQKRNIVVCHLLDQELLGRDDRQLVFFPSNTNITYKTYRPITFPNQPYEENKYK